MARDLIMSHYTYIYIYICHAKRVKGSIDEVGILMHGDDGALDGLARKCLSTLSERMQC